MLHPQSKAAVELWAQGPDITAPGFDPVGERLAAREFALAEPRPDVDHVVDVDAGGVPCRLYRPRVGAPLLIHLHGGGFVFGDLETHDAHCRRLAVATGWAVLAVDYRLAPEHVYPVASDDVDTAVGWATAHADELGVDAGRCAVLGDSAGGQLALVAAMRDPSRFEAAVLVYPCVDPSGSFASYATDPGALSTAEMDWFWSSYAPDPATRSLPELAPLDGDLRDLPRTLVITAEHDILVDEGEALADRLAHSGVDVTGVRYLGMVHGFFPHPELFDAAGAAIAQVAVFLAGRPRDAAVAGG